MASRLNNLRRTLTWADFQGTAPADDPENALTASNIQQSGVGIAHVRGGVTLADTLTVSVVMDTQASWVSAGTQSDALLNHEQGHYNITALTARDLFIDLMQVKARTFPNSGALQTELNRIMALYTPQTIHNRYDATSETHGGRNVAQQQAWDGLIQRAFNTPRVPEQRAPDGTVYKLRLGDVLRTAGKL